MGFKLFESIKVTEDINAIVEYIQYTLSNHSAAVSFLDDIQSCYNQLSDNPFVFQDGDGMFVPKGIRRAIIGRYLLFYMIDEANSVVHIVRFLYGAMRYEDLLQ